MIDCLRAQIEARRGRWRQGVLRTITERTHVPACVPLINSCVHSDVYHFPWLALLFLL